MNMGKRLLIIGGRTYQDTINPRIGGTTVLMDNYLDYCSRHDVPYFFISTNKYYGKFSSIRNLLFMLLALLRNISKCDIVMVNISSKPGFIVMLPFYVIVTKLFGKKTVIRMFAGSIHRYIESKKILKPFIFWCLKQTKVSFFETKELIKYFKENGYDAVWFPNVREPNNFHVDKPYDKNLVFISQIREGKGIDYLLELSNVLPDDYHIDIYGPIVENKYTTDFFTPFKAKYKGVLKSDEVIRVLSNYDVLVLPTFLTSEGYPGIIIEAQSIGMPVISTFCGGIPELIENGVNGILVPMKNKDALEKAILGISQEEYDRLSQETDKIFNSRFNSDTVNKRITDLMLN